MNVDFTDKELQVIGLINPGSTPEDTCNAVLRDWFNANLLTLPVQAKTSDEIVDEVLAVNAQQAVEKDAVAMMNNV